MPTPINISASRSAAILGISDYSTQVTAWQEICESLYPGFNKSRGYHLPPREENAAMRWGTAFENSVLDLLENILNEKIINRNKLFIHPEREFVTCHIDGETKSGVFVGEAKTTSTFMFHKKYGEPGTDRIPSDYACQVQTQLMIKGKENAIVPVLVFPKTPDDWEKMGWGVSIDNGYHVIFKPLKKENIHDKDSKFFIDPMEWAQTLADMGFFHQYHIKSNQSAHKVMLEVYDEFWHKNVLEKIAPEPKNYADVKRLFPEPKGVIRATDQLERWSAEYDDITGETGKGADLVKRKDELKLLIAQEMCRLGNQAGHDFNSDGVEKLILMDSQGNKLRSYGKEKKGTVLR